VAREERGARIGKGDGDKAHSHRRWLRRIGPPQLSFVCSSRAATKGGKYQEKGCSPVFHADLGFARLHSIESGPNGISVPSSPLFGIFFQSRRSRTWVVQLTADKRQKP
jgi:hypothetical protein